MINLSELMAGTSAKALFKGIDTWKKETMMKKVKVLHLLIPEFLVICSIFACLLAGDSG